MLKNILKKIIKQNYKNDLDARYWIQKALLIKSYKNSIF
tara:strand:+ start:290 stop:406 length:117 start_codon:yes stop_codon:yes gene_type:complete